MRVLLSFFAFLLSIPAIADSEIGKLGKIVLDLGERGLLPAYITIEYSLTDDCNFADLRVTENSDGDALGPEVVDEIVSVMIGPFASSMPSDELLQFSTDGGSRLKALSTTTRTFSWTTNDGYRYVVCRFYSDGELESARLTDGHGPQYDMKVDYRTIGQALSELEPRTISVSFMPEEDEQYNYRLPRKTN